MKKYFDLKIITPNEVFFEGQIISLNCETTEGRYGILVDHCATIAGVVPTITSFIDKDNNSYSANTDRGILKIRNNEVTILCDSASWTNK